MNARIRSRIGPKYWSSSSWPLGDGAPNSVRPVSSRSGRCSASRRSTRKYSCSGPMFVNTRLDGRVAEPAQDAERLGAERLLRAQERDLEVERLARVRDVRGRDRQRDAVGLDLEEDRAGDVPAGVAARLERGAQAARREGARVRLALDEVPAGELGDRVAVTGRGQERVVLLGRRAGHRHEPVGVVGRAVRQRPFLHAMGHRVDDRRIERLLSLDRPPQLAEDGLGEVLALGPLVEHVVAVDVGAGVLEVVLGLGDPVDGDLRDGGLSSGHGSPCRCRASTASGAIMARRRTMSVRVVRDAPLRRVARRLVEASRGPGCGSVSTVGDEGCGCWTIARDRVAGRVRWDGGPRRAGRAAVRIRARRRRSDPSATRCPAARRARSGSRPGGAAGRTRS